MKNLKLNKKLLSIIIALGVSLNSSVAVANNASCEMYYEDNVYMNYENPNNPYYRRYNPDTRELSYISIFDDENISSNQYGARQIDFSEKADELVSNPLIWDEMQRYFPVSDFASVEEARGFYKIYFGLISHSGCGYAATANSIFRFFEGKEDEFLNTFGYPMYTVSNDGKIDFNYEIFMLKFFNYYNLVKRDIRDLIFRAIERDLCELRLNLFVSESGYSPSLPNDFRRWPRDEQRQWYEENAILYGQYQRLRTEWINTENVVINLGIETDRTFGFLRDFLREYGLNIQINCHYTVRSYNENDIVSSDNYFLQQITADGNATEVLDDRGWHYVYVVSSSDDKVIISSWGNKYIFNNNCDDSAKVLIKII